jgi:hypothetical protein
VFINVGYKVGQRFFPTGGEIHLALRENPVFACKPILIRVNLVTPYRGDYGRRIGKRTATSESKMAGKHLRQSISIHLGFSEQAFTMITDHSHVICVSERFITLLLKYFWRVN